MPEFLSPMTKLMPASFVCFREQDHVSHGSDGNGLDNGTDHADGFGQRDSKRRLARHLGAMLIEAVLRFCGHCFVPRIEETRKW